MNLEDKVTLSFYKELTALRNDHTIVLVQHIDNGIIYIKKKINTHDQSLYEELKQLQISGIPRIHHILSDESGLIVIEDYINEENLEMRLRQQSTFSPVDAFDIALQLCDILQQLHNATPPIIHRDIKPSNILLSRNNRVTLIDFDASKTYDYDKNQDTVLMGTASYAAPEQFGFSQSDARTDIYAIGVLLNELLTGHLPKEQMYQGFGAKIIEKCLNIDPAQRYESAAHLAKEIQNLLYSGKANSSRNFTPPGFRSKTPWKMAVGILGYITAIWLAIISEFNEASSQLELTINRVGVFCMELLLIALYTNYLSLPKTLPLIRQQKLHLKVLGYLLWTFICMWLIFSLIDIAVILIV